MDRGVSGESARTEREGEAMSKFSLQVEVVAPPGWLLSLVTEPGKPPRFELTPDPAYSAKGGHGHVFPRADGAVAKCGGPKICSECAKDQAVLDARLFGNGWLMVDGHGRLQHMDPTKVAILP